MDILRVLSAPDLEVRKKTLALALDLVTSRTIEEVCSSIFILVYLASLIVSVRLWCDGRRIDPSCGQPIELYLVPASAPRLV